MSSGEKSSEPSSADDLTAYERKLPAESAVTTEHSVEIKGSAVPYKATAGTQPVWDADGKVVASLFYTYYERSDVVDKTSRPLALSFNGGPGSASLWMHIAYTGPVALNIDDEGYPLQPYGLKANPHSILDVCDIVYIDPVNTGFSRILDPSVDRKLFFGVNADIKYLADWLDVFVSRVDRWTSPKYIIGESYGTTRVSGLALELQTSHYMYLNGVVLVSPTELGIKREGPVYDASYLPYYCATAWYHGVLDHELQAKDLEDILPEVEQFTIQELLPVLAQGGFVDPEIRSATAAKMATYSGMSDKVILQHNLAVPPSFFWKELLRDEGFTVGRLDSRYKGMDSQDAGDRPDYNAEMAAWNHEFAPAMNQYVRSTLGFKTDLQYNLFGPVHPWDSVGDTYREDTGGAKLRRAMAQNPYMHVLTQSGYYDGACDYFNAKYSMWNMDPSGKLRDRMDWKGYRSGHMMYLRAEDLAASNDDLRDFIHKTTPAVGTAAKY